MFTIAHLSDLRFGAITAETVTALLADLKQTAPDLVVVSGNLTRRGAKEQFVEARDFLDRLPEPHLVVPGSTDTQHLNLIDRWFRPLRTWREAMSTDLDPFFSSDEVAVLGINTAGATKLGKKISVAQAGTIRTRLGSLRQMTVLVSHHPLVPRPASGTTTVLRPETKDLHVVGKCVDLVLAGHSSVGSTQDTKVAYRVLDRKTIVAQAALSPVSAGGRDSTPYYNAVRIDGEKVGIAVRLWRGSVFEEQGSKSYRYNGAIWEKYVDMPPDFQWTDSGDTVAGQK